MKLKISKSALLACVTGVLCGCGGGEDAAPAPLPNTPAVTTPVVDTSAQPPRGIPAATALKAECPKLAQVTIPNAKITTAEYFPAGSFTSPTEQSIKDLPAFCRISATITPTSDSNIRMELWLPVENWNRRFLGLGNGGFAGQLDYPALGEGLKRGFAVAHTDMGTSPLGTNGATVNNALVGRPEKIIDWGWRSTHEMTVFSKTITNKLYTTAADKSYFSGCSTGGGQGLHEAQRFPTDYDGIIVGAPANERVATHTSILWNSVATRATPENALPFAKRALWAGSVTAACDATDGVTDGIISRPEKCNWSPRALQCSGADAANCLTLGQVTAIERIYEGPTDTVTGEKIFPGMARGTEAAMFVYDLFPQPVFSELFNLVFGPSWDWRTFDFGGDYFASQTALGANLNANNPDLKSFRANGGKILMYTGWSDFSISPHQTINYFNRINAATGAEDFTRLFLAPGMGHCGGGNGPNFFGQDVTSAPFMTDPNRDLLTAMTTWVESGKAPEQVIATQYDNGNASTGTVLRTRPLCAYPRVARYNGTGDTNNAASFICINPD